MKFETIHTEISKIIFSSNCYGKEHVKVKNMLNTIKKFNGYSIMGDLVNDITIHMMTPGIQTNVKPIDKFDPKRSSLYTFLMYQVLGFLSTKIRNDSYYNVEEIDDSDLGDEDFSVIDITPAQGKNPEEILINKEFIQQMERELSKDDIDLIMGLRTNQELGDECGITRQGYNLKYLRRIKKLQNKHKGGDLDA